MSTIRNATVDKVARAFLTEPNFQYIEDNHDNQTWWFTGLLKTDTGDLKKGEEVYLEADMQSGVFSITPVEESRKVHMYGTMDVTINWKMEKYN